MTSITQKPPANDSGSRTIERRVDPGRNVNMPERVNPPSKLSPAPPRVSGRGVQRGAVPK